VHRPPAAPSAAKPQALFPAYADALLKVAALYRELVVLDADLIKDMGLIPFAERHPERFFECGIAEQDMVSMAGGLARAGMLPVVHSFSCFLSTRPNEQIYNNATEHTKIIYVGGLSGVLPAGPGHSHQSVREISAIGGVPNLIMVAPSCPDEVGPLLEWCIEKHDGPAFLRMVSLPALVDFELPAGYRPELGIGVTLTGGKDALLISSGPTMLAQAVAAAKTLATRKIGLSVVNLPWLNYIDQAWLREVIGGRRLLVTLDDHYVEGGQGEKILAALAALGSDTPTLTLGLRSVPPSGQPAEVLASLGLDASGIARKISDALARKTMR
jgi:transketolase